MLRIGEFAQLSQVTIKTLHHYDELNLLNPAQIDPDTNYRYYTLEQLPRVHRIMALKELGLSLEQIGVMLNQEVPTEQIRGMLRLKQSEAQEQIRSVEQQLAMIGFRLRMIEVETDFPNLDVVVKRLEPMRCLSFFVPRPPTFEAAMQQMETVAGVLNHAISEGAIQSTGQSVDKFFGDALIESSKLVYDKHEILHGVTEHQKDVEIRGIGQLKITDVAPVEAAATLMLSAKEDSFLPTVEKATLLRRWAIEHGYRPADGIRFFNYRGPLDTLNRDEFVFEAQLPINSA